MCEVDEDYLRAFNALESCYRSVPDAELGDLLGNMDINISDGAPMDPLMLDYWGEARASTEGFDAVIKFLEIWASKFKHCPPALSRLIGELRDKSSSLRREAIMSWNQPVIRP